ncbi:RagB/SusD family nutrient uptake outer membrane protein [Sinomicrobium soli]|uniref:RagB/SusD family nutrient uptake outer membrane protein n=1 Tax=Sinomicrobium sp. N-1-3-6 TaxID=2219864 RepID=UPI0013752617|nr:RagB/SusD family nutrient uptake outer membrane protein [Sinomicrobium sp. N-1-3-6]
MKSKILISGLIIALLSSCNDDFLTRNPLDTPSSSTFFSNEAELEMALAGVYRNLYWHSYSVPYHMWLDACTDIAWSRGDFGDALTIQSGNYTPEWRRFELTWQHMYEGIARANNILVNMDRAREILPEEKYLDTEAQARFLRAYYYVYLTNLYGDVPWVDKMLTLEEAQLPRTPEGEILDKIYEDLDFAAEHLLQPQNEGKATRDAALTLKARAALLAGDYETAATAAGKVMDSGNYSIHPDYGELFSYAGGDSPEIIFKLHNHIDVFVTQIPRYLSPRVFGGYSVLIPTQNLVDMYQATDGMPIDESPLYDPAHPFENRDPRMDQTILLPGEYINGFLFQTHPDSTQTYQQTGTDLKRVPNPEVTNPYATFSGYLFNKYLDESDIPDRLTQSPLELILMRYAEVLLTYAEARIELNQIDETVINAINQVRGRQNVQMPPVSPEMSVEELRKTVRYERSVELALEGFRLFDIRRWKYAEHVMPGNMLGRRHKEHWSDPIVPEIDDYGHPSYPDETETFQIMSTNAFDPGRDYLWAIPQTEINLNPNLRQNPGY